MLVIAATALVAALMMPGQGTSFEFGAFLTVLLVILAFRIPWLGLLAVFPLAASLHPAPQGIGLHEALFALLVATVSLKFTADALFSDGWQALLKRFGLPLVLAGGLAIVNLLVAVSHGVGLADWARGIVPFLFIGLFIPVALALDRHPDRVRWIGISIGAAIALLAGRVVFFYLTNDLHHPYWMATVDGVSRRIPETLASLYPDARGPMLDRVTVHLPGASDALLPAGLVAGFMVATLASARRIAALGYAVSLLCLTAILMTYTRSMLLSAMIVLAFFMLQIAFSSRLLKKATILMLGVALVAAGVVVSLSIEPLWGYRIGQLVVVNAVDDTASSVASRLDEYRIAWKRFLWHPLLGNGLGAKHAIRFYGNEGWVSQYVAYIHNWPLYFLMTMGITGFLAYAWVLLTPAFKAGWSASPENGVFIVLRAIILTMAIYGLFFAVFRLITFNLLLGAVWGMVLAYGQTLRTWPGRTS